MDDLIEVVALSNDLSYWCCKRCLEKLMRKNEAEQTLFVEEAESLFDKDDIDIKVAGARRGVNPSVMIDIVRCPFADGLNSDIRRVADDGVEAAGGKNMGEGALPVKGVDPMDLFFVGEHLPLEVVPADQRISAADVLTQVG